MRDPSHNPKNTIARLEAEIARQQETIAELKAKGHACPDAERQLQRFMDSLALLASSRSQAGGTGTSGSAAH
jgi:uncharacterized coiled-coil protein SlyX